MKRIDEFWHEFLAITGTDPITKYVDSFSFGATKEMANELLDLVLCGKKKATASSLWTYKIENDRIHKVGDYSIVTDWGDIPRCVIQIVAVTIIPFCEMTFDICKREGEDDNLASWKDGHSTFFTNEGITLGYSFSKDMPVVFEDFTLIFAP